MLPRAKLWDIKDRSERYDVLTFIIVRTQKAFYICVQENSSYTPKRMFKSIP